MWLLVFVIRIGSLRISLRWDIVGKVSVVYVVVDWLLDLLLEWSLISKVGE